MSYRYILLDADNTLFDFDRAEYEALRTAMESSGAVFQPSYIDIYHRINTAFWRAYEAGSVSKEELRFRRFEQLFSEIGVDIDAHFFADAYLGKLGGMGYLIDGAVQLLEFLSARYRMVLVTNGLKEVQHHRLDNAGIRSFFEAVVISDEIGHSKPAAAFFQHTMQQIDNPPRREVLMVGDNFWADIRGGHDYGLDTCWYNPGRLPRPLDIQPTYEIDELDQLSRLLDQI